MIDVRITHVLGAAHVDVQLYTLEGGVPRPYARYVGQSAADDLQQDHELGYVAACGLGALFVALREGVEVPMVGFKYVLTNRQGLYFGS